MSRSWFWTGMALVISMGGPAFAAGDPNCFIAAVTGKGKTASRSRSPSAHLVVGSAVNDIAPATSGKLSAVVPGIPIQDQQCAEICWAYALNELTDGEHLASTGETLITSPDHNGFWHLYFQFQSHTQYFLNLGKRVKAGKVSEQKAVDDALRLLKMRPGAKAAADAGFDPNPGSDESTALKEVALIGLVPKSVYSTPFTTQQQETDLETGLKAFIKVMMDPTQNSQFGSANNAADGINDALFTALTTKLQPAIGTQLPLRPGDSFQLAGQTYNPLTFMSNKMGFDPTQWGDYAMTPDTHDLVNQARRTSLTGPQPHSVPIGLAVYNQQAIEQSSVFAAQNIIAGQAMDGGHEVNERAVIDATDGTMATLDANSWGEKIGLTIAAKPPQSGESAGFFIITDPYIQALLAMNEGPDFVFHNGVAAQYPGLQTLKQVAEARRKMAARARAASASEP